MFCGIWCPFPWNALIWCAWKSNVDLTLLYTQTCTTAVPDDHGLFPKSRGLANVRDSCGIFGLLRSKNPAVVWYCSTSFCTKDWQTLQCGTGLKQMAQLWINDENKAKKYMCTLLEFWHPPVWYVRLYCGTCTSTMHYKNTTEYIWKQVAFVPCMMHVILPHAQPMLQGHPEIFVMGAILGWCIRKVWFPG